MDKEKLYGFYLRHRGEITGTATGLIAAIMILSLGFFKSLFIAVLVFLGYYIGKRVANDKDYLKNLLDRILPPGTYR